MDACLVSTMIRLQRGLFVDSLQLHGARLTHQHTTGKRTDFSATNEPAGETPKTRMLSVCSVCNCVRLEARFYYNVTSDVCGILKKVFAF